MINFRKLVIQNFMSYREKTVVPLSGLGVVRVEGKNLDDSGATSNMAGKSTIVEALLWCLFGKTLRGLKHNEIINRKTKHNCYVALEFRSGDVSYRVWRYRRHKRHQNSLRVYRENKLIRYRHEAENQKKLEEILECDYQAFVNSTVFGGFDGSRRQFALLADKEQKKILDSFLRFEKFELALDRTKESLRGVREDKHKNAVEIAEQEGKVNMYREKTATLVAGANLLKDRERREQAKLLQELKSLKSKIQDIDIHRFDKEIEGAEEQVETLTTNLAKLRGSQDAASRSLKKLTHAIKNRKSLVGTMCPTCGQRIKLPASGFEDHLASERAKVKDELQHFSHRVLKMQRRYAYGRDVLKRLQEKQNKIENTLRIQEERRGEIEKRLLSVGPQSPFQIKIEESRREYNKALSRYLVLLQMSKELDSREKGLEFWEVGFGNRGVKTLVLREMLPSMNRKLKEYSSQIFGSKVELEFRPSRTTKKGEERELFHLHYKSKFNSTSYAGESSGGRRRIDICILLVFAWIARCSNLLLVDELLDGLDESGREATLDILSKQRGTIFVITHNRQLKSDIGNTWTVVKKNGVSRLEMPNG